MVHIEGATFLMGSDRHYPEEAPAHPVRVDGFRIDATPVTNRQFAEFVAASGYETLAERPPNPNDYPGLLPEMARAGSLVFTPPPSLVSHNAPLSWWRFEFGADWRHPYGPGTSIAGLEEHPVVHIAYDDADAYARWAGKVLPTEAEWELAARGGLEAAEFAWGDTFEPGGKPQANYWQGAFPWWNELRDGYARTSPVGAFAANGHGLYDMIGNVWEWTVDWFVDHTAAPASKAAEDSCCIPRNPRGGKREASYDPCTPDIAIGRKVLKGGSHLCAENYCQRYRPAARYAQPIDTSTSHVGFRCIVRDTAAETSG